MTRFNLLGFATRLFVAFAAIILLLPTTTSSQVINVRTVPLLSSDQFSLAPSIRSGMGGVEIAVDDELQDVFINPAKSRRLRRGFAFSAPLWNTWSFEQDRSSLYFGENPGPVLSETEHEAAGSSVLSVPLGQVGRGEKTSFGFAMTYQRLRSQTRHSWQHSPPNSGNLRETHFKATNLPMSFVSGIDVPGTNFALGAGINFVLIRGIDGVNLLYPDNSRLEQKGFLAEYRFGAVGSFTEGDEISLLGLGHTFSVEQEAYYTNPPAQVRNKDKNHGWLVRTEYRRVLSENVRVGLQVTGNWKNHPKIPDYPLSGIPRDPGTTKAFDLGVGLGWKNKTTLIAFDAIYEPIDTKTWVEAENEIRAADGRIISRGGITMRNDYTFSNRILRVGMETELANWLRVRAGSQMKFFKYDYHQEDVIAGTERSVSPQSKWTEVSLTGGATIALGNTELLYTVQMVTGNGLLTVSRPRWFGIEAADFSRADFLIPPSDWMSVRPVPVFVQQLTVVYKLSN